MHSILQRLGCKYLLLIVKSNMVKESLLDYWCELRSRQLDWAFNAYDRLLKTLSPDVQERLRLKNNVADPYVVIFGKTQVGKTTLLLDLMGVEPSKIKIVSDVLRGGREAGKSATATAMEYCRSEAARWGLSIQSNTRWFDSTEDITHALGQLRDDMERGCLNVDSPCVVHIPAIFFADASPTTPSVRILDLPGDHPALENEQNHVIQVAKTFLPFADLILLVGKGDDLSFLRPGAIALPGIEDWQSMPFRFRIVTTYTYSAKSLKDFLRGNENVDSAQVRTRLVEQIEKFGCLNGAAKDINLYFPLEFGASWMNIEKNEPPLYARMAPIIGTLRKELLEQIVNATTPIGRIRNTLNAHLSVKYVQKKKKDVINGEILKLKKREGTVRSEIELWRKSIEKSQNKLCKVIGTLERNSLENGIGLINMAATEPHFSPPNGYPPSENSKKNDREILWSVMSRYYRLLESMRLNVVDKENAAYWSRVRRHVSELEIGSIQDVLNDEFFLIHSRLNGYWFDTYLSSSKYNADLRAVHHAGEASKARLVKLWKNSWFDAVKVVDNELQLECRNEKMKIKSDSEEKDSFTRQLCDIENEVYLKNTELECIRRNGEEDLVRCNEFICLLDEEYLKELTNRIDITLQGDDSCESLLHLLSCVGLMYQREEFIQLQKKGGI